MRLFADPEVVPYQGYIRIKNREGRITRTGLYVLPEVDEINPLEGNFTIVSRVNKRNGRTEYCIGPGKDESLDTAALVFYYVMHPRQRLQGAETSPDCILTTGCYGAAVVALMMPQDRLLFRNGKYFEEVLFTGENIKVRTGRD